MGVVRVIVILLRAFLLPRATLGAETLALRHQLGVLQRSVKRRRLRKRDRVFWVWLSRLWVDWRSRRQALAKQRKTEYAVRPATQTDLRVLCGCGCRAQGELRAN
jgi:hypothetical protein